MAYIKVNGYCDETIERIHDMTQQEEENHMKNEFNIYGSVLLIPPPIIICNNNNSYVHITKNNYDKKDPLKRLV